jgi:mannose-6-phosphate isomerase-like protein (cupin superfamily)
MKIARPNELKEVFTHPLGEQMFAMLNEENSGAKQHSLYYNKIPVGKCGPKAFHKITEATYLIISGKANIVVDGKDNAVSTGDALLMLPNEVHQIFNTGDSELIYIAIDAPAWSFADTFAVED